MTDKFVEESGIQNLVYHIKEKAKAQLSKDLKEKCGLTDEQIEQFKAGFEETVYKGRAEHGKEIYDKRFENATDEVQVLIKDITDTLFDCLWASGFSFPVGGPKDLFTYIDALKNAYEAGSALNIAWDNIPESKPPRENADQGAELVILGIFFMISYGKRKK